MPITQSWEEKREKASGRRDSHMHTSTDRLKYWAIYDLSTMCARNVRYTGSPSCPVRRNKNCRGHHVVDHRKPWVICIIESRLVVACRECQIVGRQDRRAGYWLGIQNAGKSQMQRSFIVFVLSRQPLRIRKSWIVWVRESKLRDVGDEDSDVKSVKLKYMHPEDR